MDNYPAFIAIQLSERDAGRWNVFMELLNGDKLQVEEDFTTQRMHVMRENTIGCKWTVLYCDPPRRPRAFPVSEARFAC